LENKGQIGLSVLVVVATLGILVLIFFIIFIVLLYQKRMQANKIERSNSEKEHQKKLLDASLEVAEQERQKIAVNIHDEVGLNLSILKINLNKLVNSKEKESLEGILATSYALIDGSIEIVRGIYNDIRPKTLITMGLVAAIRELGREINLSGAAEVIIICPDEINVRDKNRELQLHRLIKEVLNNTLRHAKPTFIEINIENIENKLGVSILHNGVGITTEKIKELAEKSKGLGLKSIFTRTGLLEADIDFTIEDKEKAKVFITCSLI
jgi:signal transduction histidine kinase